MESLTSLGIGTLRMCVSTPSCTCWAHGHATCEWPIIVRGLPCRHLNGQIIGCNSRYNMLGFEASRLSNQRGVSSKGVDYAKVSRQGERIAGGIEQIRNQEYPARRKCTCQSPIKACKHQEASNYHLVVEDRGTPLPKFNLTDWRNPWSIIS